MTSAWAYTALVLAVLLERVAELVVADRHLRWARERGAREAGQGHYPFMVVLHGGLLVGCLAEVWLLDRPAHLGLALAMLLLVLASQSLRWWCIRTLGTQWNTRVLVVPGQPLVRSGPYRYGWLRHPNYVAVATEGLALPLVHTAWLTALVFTVLNAGVLTTRIRCENRLLAEVSA